MLGGIKAILFLKQCPPLTNSIIPPRLLLQNEMSCSRASAGVRSGDPRFNWELEAINVAAPELDPREAKDYPGRPWVGEDLGAMFSALGETLVWRWR